MTSVNWILRWSIFLINYQLVFLYLIVALWQLSSAASTVSPVDWFLSPHVLFQKEFYRLPSLIENAEATTQIRKEQRTRIVLNSYLHWWQFLIWFIMVSEVLETLLNMDLGVLIPHYHDMDGRRRHGQFSIAFSRIASTELYWLCSFCVQLWEDRRARARPRNPTFIALGRNISVLCLLPTLTVGGERTTTEGSTQQSLPLTAYLQIASWIYWVLTALSRVNLTKLKYFRKLYPWLHN